MTNELAQRDSAAVANVSVDKGEILKYLGLRSDDPAAQAAVLICQRYGLDPVLKHVVLIEENSKDDDGKWQKVGKPFITRDGMLHIAHESGELDGIRLVVDPHLNEAETHWVARVEVYRAGKKFPFSLPGRFPRMRKRWTGPKNNRTQIDEEHPYGPEMAIKNTVSISLRHAFNVSAPVFEEQFDRADVMEASVVGHVEETGGLPPWVTELVEAYGPQAVREAGRVEFLEHLTDDDEQRLRDALGQASDQADGSGSSPSDEGPKEEVPDLPPLLAELRDRFGEQEVEDAANRLRADRGLKTIPFSGLADSSENALNAVKAELESGQGDTSSDSDASGTPSTTPAQSASEGDVGAADAGETVPVEQTASPSPQHPCPECGTECIETPESSTKWACPNGDFESYHVDPWKEGGEVESILRVKAYTPEQKKLYDTMHDFSAKDAVKAVNGIEDRAQLERVKLAESDGRNRKTVLTAIDKRLESEAVTGGEDW